LLCNALGCSLTSMSRLAPRALRIGLCVVVGLVLGCSDSSEVPPLRRSGPITKAEALAFASAVNLGVADVPGATSLGLEHEVTPSRMEAEQNRCLRGPGRGIVQRRSPAYVRGRARTGVEKATSIVGVRATAAAGLRDVEAVRRWPTRACWKPLVDRATAKRVPKGLRYQLGMSPLRDRLPRLNIVGMRIRTRLLAPHRRRFYNDYFFFVVGRAEMVLEASCTVHPPSSANERRLLSLLYSRAKAGAS
jgi:hypothetical protein